jgi:hypothetical protein
VVNNEERRIRQGGTLGKGGLLCFGVIFLYWRKEKGGGSGDYVSFMQLFCAYRLENFHRGHLLLGILGSGARKP